MQIILAATTDKIQLITSAACSLDVHTSFIECSDATPPVPKAPDKQNTAITTAATTDVLASPGANTRRQMASFFARNKHASSSVDVTVLYNQNATLFEIFKTTLKAGETLEYIDGIGFFVLQVTALQILQKVLSADDTGGQNVLTAQPWFPTQGALTVPADTTYYMEGVLYVSRAAGTTSHTTGVQFGGTATLTSIAYTAKTQVGETDALLPLSRVTSRVATNTTVKAASTTATEQFACDIEGIIRISAAGTLIPQFIYSAAPGGTPTIKANTYFRLTPMGNGSYVSTGVWA